MRWLDGIIDSGHEFDQAPGVGEGQGSLEYYSPRGNKESDMTEWMNWAESPVWLSSNQLPSLMAKSHFINKTKDNFVTLT